MGTSLLIEAATGVLLLCAASGILCCLFDRTTVNLASGKLQRLEQYGKGCGALGFQQAFEQRVPALYALSASHTQCRDGDEIALSKLALIAPMMLLEIRVFFGVQSMEVRLCCCEAGLPLLPDALFHAVMNSSSCVRPKKAVGRGCRAGSSAGGSDSAGDEGEAA